MITHLEIFPNEANAIKCRDYLTEILNDCETLEEFNDSVNLHDFIVLKSMMNTFSIAETNVSIAETNDETISYENVFLNASSYEIGRLLPILMVYECAPIVKESKLWSYIDDPYAFAHGVLDRYSNCHSNDNLNLELIIAIQRPWDVEFKTFEILIKLIPLIKTFDKRMIPATNLGSPNSIVKLMEIVLLHIKRINHPKFITCIDSVIMNTSAL